ncbi:MAG: hypothetical protein COW18_05920 [Zetaproteobacteria bacterium CG12_big_fil_rev_8_21_14_0_65_54_13]|nr:MAG: hypothetical protein COX55_04215 [Zetaproteobacteria bacterium CG23_combo_of_CG06-09_8_20_14_all_54_7]PIW49192.1 MAG: hypothetical protein COW18_05920 [Zetaproteobacteria bacterium CG12_big_fil_rev_8_21_14_0_65_54_13]PIX55458.1 MAG: hypothetical protein COZ50_02545 [Zetaproteobacteria bacterium CG_4_10_14_3_um_filter_54_28]PJA29224.1 MAG: hypothetical protein CO188_07120 [Zetaproteobacteria bacterium CG_4_9_14_3_um_filter_54_145]
MQPHPEKSPPAISIRRHCMQKLLHAVIIHEPQNCFGLLAKGGNIVETYLDVTQKLLSSEQEMVACIRQQQAELALRQQHICAIYHNTHASESDIARLTNLYRSVLGEMPECYLALDPDHPGRIDARLYSDRACTQGIGLEMVEDAAG